jgi:chromosome partitioning protein
MSRPAGQVLTVAQQKGGAGKTMLAANLAAAFAASRRVAAVDIDPQRSLVRWATLRAARPDAASRLAVSVHDVAGWRLAAELDRLRRDHDLVLVDSPPQIDSTARQAVRAASLVLVPLQPSLPDLWAADGTLDLAAAEHRPVRLVLNRTPASSRLRTEIEKSITARGLQLLSSTLGNRAGFATSFAVGLGVCEAAPRSLAAAEILALVQEIDAWLNGLSRA